MRTSSSRTGMCSGWSGGGANRARSAAGSPARAASNTSTYFSRSIHWALGVRRGGGGLFMVEQEGGQVLAAVLQRPFDRPQAAAGQLGDLVDLVALHAQLHDVALQRRELGEGFVGRHFQERHAGFPERV